MPYLIVTGTDCSVEVIYTFEEVKEIHKDHQDGVDDPIHIIKVDNVLDLTEDEDKALINITEVEKCKFRYQELEDKLKDINSEHLRIKLEQAGIYKQLKELGDFSLVEGREQT